MEDATFAVIYCIFALLFCFLNLNSSGVQANAGVFGTVAHAYNNEECASLGIGKKTVADVDNPSELYDWLSTAFVNVTFKDQETWDTASSSSSPALKPAVVGSFNRVLLVRFTGKRWDLRNNSYGAFADRTFQRTGGANVRLEPESYAQDGEFTGIFCSPTGGRCYEYQKSGTYGRAGGYPVLLDPLNGRDAFAKKLAEMKDDGFFDLRLATFVVDLMVYNPNVDNILHFAWLFSFNVAGNARLELQSRKVTLGSVLNVSFSGGYTAIKIILAIMTVLFFFVEVKKMCELGLQGHFKKFGSMIDLISLVTSALALASYAWLQSMRLVNDFDFGELLNPSTSVAVYDELEDVARNFSIQSYLIAFNLLVVFVRAICLVAILQGNLGLMLRTVEVSFNNLLYFAGMFGIVASGFVGMAFFTFGANTEALSTLSSSVYRCFSMMTGKPIYEELSSSDAVMGPIFYFVFYVFFYLIMVNVFVSILLSGYDLVDEELDKNEEKPLWRIITTSLHHDVFGRLEHIVSYVKAQGMWLLAPVYEAMAELFNGCKMPCKCLPRWTRGRRKKEDGVQGTDSAGIDGGARRSKQDFKTAQKKRSLPGRWVFDVTLMLFFLVNFVVFAFLLVRGESSYWVMQATLRQPVDAGWSGKAQGVPEFATMESFEQVEVWTRQLLAELYGGTRCIVVQNGMSTVQDIACDNTNATHQTVQHIADWNVGFLNTTFARLTVQPACYAPKPDAKLSAGAPLYRKTPLLEGCAEASCANIFEEESCMTADGKSLSHDVIDHYYVGSTLPMSVMNTSDNASGNASYPFGFFLVTDTDEMNVSNMEGPVRFNYSRPGAELGSHGLLGGFAFGFGTTLEEALVTLGYVSEGNWFTRNSASMVFDWLTYNGNLDRFTYHVVSFSLLGTGEFVRESRAQSFPLNIANGGGFFHEGPIALCVLFLVYALLVLFYVADYAMHTRDEFRKYDHNVKRFLNAFVDDLWNVSDLVSLTLSAVSIIYILVFVFRPFRQDYRFSVDMPGKYTIPNDDVKKFGVPKESDAARGLEEDWYIFMQFETLSEIYGICLTVAALNSFFISVKVVKYVGEVSWFRPFSNTLNEGKVRNSYFAIIMTMALLGFALFFHIIFGVQVKGFATLPKAALTLFNWVIGDYELDGLFSVDYYMALIFFIIYMVGAYFIAVNMFLATMVNQYSETVGEGDIEAVKDEVERQKPIRSVEYVSQEAFQNDILEIKWRPHDGKGHDGRDREQEGEFVVSRMNDSGPASKQGVQEGCSIVKVNGSKDKWKRPSQDHVGEVYCAKATYDAINIDTTKKRRGSGLTVVFKVPQKHSMLGTIRTLVGPEVMGLAPTVKNLWSTQGALQRVLDDSSNVNHHKRVADDDDDDAGDEDKDMEAIAEESSSSSSSDGEAEGAEMADGVTKATKKKARRLLHKLLFSRWPEGRKRGKDGTAVAPDRFWEEVPLAEEVDQLPVFGDEDGQGAAFEENSVFHPQGQDVDELKDKMQKMPYSGHEVWLDCLLTAIENEQIQLGSSLVTSLLRTNDLKDVETSAAHANDQKPLREFYERAANFLKLLEHKALRKYYSSLKSESEARQETLREQNAVIFDYIRQLEERFESERSESDRKVNLMEKTLASFNEALGVEDVYEVETQVRGSQSMMETVGGFVDQVKGHMKKLNHPWPFEDTETQVAQAQAAARAQEEEDKTWRSGDASPSYRGNSLRSQ